MDQQPTASSERDAKPPKAEPKRDEPINETRPVTDARPINDASPVVRFG